VKWVNCAAVVYVAVNRLAAMGSRHDRNDDDFNRSTQFVRLAFANNNLLTICDCIALFVCLDVSLSLLLRMFPASAAACFVHLSPSDVNCRIHPCRFISQLYCADRHGIAMVRLQN